MKKLIATSLVLVAFGIVAACSQGDTHPPFIGDCDVCSQPIVSTGGDSATDVTKPDTSTNDSGNDSSTTDSSTKDAGNGEAASDASNGDGSLLDTGLLD